MKYLSLFFFLGISLAFISCTNDDEADSNGAELFLDAGPNSAPIFEAGTHEAAAKFPRSIMSNFVGQTLDRVEYYLVNVPNNTFVKIYDEGDDDSPGALLYEANVTSDVSANSWNSHALASPITLENRELWISIEFTHNDSRNTIGCDVGPSVNNGDWVLEGTQTTWRTFRDFTSDAVSINWNIRGFVE